MATFDSDERVQAGRFPKPQEAAVARRDSETLQRDSHEPGDVGVACLDLEGRLLFLNRPAAKSLGGGSPEEILGKTLDELLGKAGSNYLAHIREAAASPEPIEYQDWIDLPVGRRSLISIFTHSLDAAGNVVGICVYANDVTERERAQDALRASEDQYRTLVNAAREVIVIAQDGAIVFANRAMYDLLGVPDGSLKATPIADFIWPVDKEMVVSKHRKRIAGENVKNAYDFRVIGAGGAPTWVTLSAVLIQWNGRPATLNLLTDINARKQAEEALAQQNDLLLKLNRFAVELSLLPSEENLEAFIVRNLKELSGAEVAIFSEYDPAERTTTIKQIEIESGLLDRLVGLLGRQLNKIRAFVSDEMYQEMTTDVVGVKRTLYDASFGAISRPVG